MEVTLEFEQDVEVECPHCKKKFWKTVTGETTGEIEPPDMDGRD